MTSIEKPTYGSQMGSPVPPSSAASQQVDNSIACECDLPMSNQAGPNIPKVFYNCNGKTELSAGVIDRRKEL